MNFLDVFFNFLSMFFSNFYLLLLVYFIILFSIIMSFKYGLPGIIPAVLFSILMLLGLFSSEWIIYFTYPKCIPLEEKLNCQLFTDIIVLTDFQKSFFIVSSIFFIFFSLDILIIRYILKKKE